MADDADHLRTTSRYPSLARVYDYYLDGSFNSPLDRHLAEELQTACPAIPRIVQDQRVFLRRSIQHMLGLGIRQFIDLGSGLPTAGHVHHLAHDHDPDITVAYVDNNPTVVAHGEIGLGSTPNVRILHADVRKPTDVLNHQGLKGLIDPTQPVGITMIGVLEFISDEDNPAALLAAYKDISRTGTFIALTMVSHNDDPERRAQFDRAATIYRNTGAQLTIRPPEAFKTWLEGMTVLPPGVTPAATWSPDPQPVYAHPPNSQLTRSAVTTTVTS